MGNPINHLTQKLNASILNPRLSCHNDSGKISHSQKLKRNIILVVSRHKCPIWNHWNLIGYLKQHCGFSAPAKTHPVAKHETLCLVGRPSPRRSRVSYPEYVDNLGRTWREKEKSCGILSQNQPAPSPGTTSSRVTCDAASRGGEAHRTTERAASPAEAFPPVQGHSWVRSYSKRSCPCGKHVISQSALPDFTKKWAV